MKSNKIIKIKGRLAYICESQFFKLLGNIHVVMLGNRKLLVRENGESFIVYALGTDYISYQNEKFSNFCLIDNEQYVAIKKMINKYSIVLGELG